MLFVVLMAFMFAGTMFISASKDTSAKLFDVDSLECHKTYSTERPVNSASISPTQDHVSIQILNKYKSHVLSSGQRNILNSPSHLFVLKGRARRWPRGDGRDNYVHADWQVRRALLPHGVRGRVRPRQGSLRPNQHSRVQPGRQRLRERRRGRLCQASHF